MTQLSFLSNFLNETVEECGLKSRVSTTHCRLLCQLTKQGVLSFIFLFMIMIIYNMNIYDYYYDYK